MSSSEKTLAPRLDRSVGASLDRSVFATVFVVAALLATPLSHPNENRTLDQLHAMAAGRLTIDAEHQNTGDKAYVPSRPSAAALELGGVVPATELRGGHFYNGGAPGLAVVLFPAYLALRTIVPGRLMELALVLLGAALPLAFAAVFVARATRALLESSPGTPDSRLTSSAQTGLVFALATTALPLGTRLFAHSLVIGLFAGALALLLEKPAARRSALAGLLAAVAVAADYNAAPQAVMIAILSLVTGGARGGFALFLGTLPVVVALGAYHQVCFGSPLKTPYDFLWNGQIVEIVQKGAYGFTYPRPWILLELLFGHRRGFLWCQPAALVGLLGLLREARRSRIFALALAAVVLAFLANASRAIDWESGSCFGPRYTSHSLPFLALGLPSGLALLGRAGKPVLAASAALAFMGAVTAWGQSVLTSVDWLWLLGPRLAGLSALLLGTPEGIVNRGSVCVAAFGLSIALVVAATTWRRTEAWPRPVPLLVPDLVALALVPWLLATPVLVAIFRGGEPEIERRNRKVVVNEGLRAIASASDAEEMHRLVWQIGLSARAVHAPRLYLKALDRVLELDPGATADRELRDRLRAQLPPEPADDVH